MASNLFFSAYIDYKTIFFFSKRDKLIDIKLSFFFFFPQNVGTENVMKKKKKIILPQPVLLEAEYIIITIIDSWIQKLLPGPQPELDLERDDRLV